MPSADLEILKAAIDDLSIYSFILSILSDEYPKKFLSLLTQ